MEVKDTVKTVLLNHRKEVIRENFSELMEIRDVNFLTEKFNEVFINLLNEGYNPIEIQEFINEADIFPTNMEDYKNLDWKSIMGDALLSNVKEYVIHFVLTKVFNANPSFSTFAAQVFADLSPLDLLKPFKNEQMCQSNMPKIVDALLEALSRYIASDVAGTNRNSYGLNVADITQTSAGNIFGEIIRDSNVGETISNKFCSIIH